MSTDINREKHLLLIDCNDAAKTVEDEIKRIETRRIIFRRQIKKRFSNLTDEEVQIELDKFNRARTILKNKMTDPNTCLDEISVSSLLFYTNCACLSSDDHHHVRIGDTQIIIQPHSVSECLLQLCL